MTYSYICVFGTLPACPFIPTYVLVQGDLAKFSLQCHLVGRAKRQTKAQWLPINFKNFKKESSVPCSTDNL